MPENVGTPKSLIDSWPKATLVYLLAFFAATHPLLLKLGEPLYDAATYFAPVYAYLADSVRQGRLPLWDPYTNCGLPFHAEPQNMLLNPIALLTALFVPDNSLGFVLVWTLHWFWGGAGMLWFARGRGAVPVGGLMAALAYGFSGFFVAHSQHTSYILLAAWVPWVFGLAELAVSSANPGYIILGGVAAGLASLGGYPGLFLFMLLALSLWLVFNHLSFPVKTGRGGSGPLFLLLTVTGVSLIALAIWSPILHAFFSEGTGFTNRTLPLDPKIADFSNSFPLTALVSLAFPSVTASYRPLFPSDASMTNAYMGIMAVPLATIWWIDEKSRRKAWGILAFTLLMFLVSLGGEAKVRSLFAAIFPPLQYMKFSAPFRLFWILPVSLAAGLGFSRFIPEPSLRPLLLKLLCIWSGIVLFAVIWVSAITGTYIDIPNLMRQLSPGYVILPAAILSVWLAGNPENPMKRHIGLLLPVLMVIDMVGHVYVCKSTVWSADGTLHRQNSVEGKASQAFLHEPPARSLREEHYPNNFHLFKKQFVVSGYTTLVNPDFNYALSHSRFTELLMAPFRFWLVPAESVIPPPSNALSILSSLGNGDVVPVYAGMSGSRQEGRFMGVVPGSFGSVRTVTYFPELVTLEVLVPPGKGGFLASTERSARGWRVLVDGLEQPLQQANLFFRGVYVPSGSHSVSWEYRPAGWWPLVGLSVGVFIICSIGGMLLLRRDRRKAA